MHVPLLLYVGWPDFILFHASRTFITTLVWPSGNFDFIVFGQIFIVVST